jgi:HlyD family secretion protein
LGAGPRGPCLTATGVHAVHLVHPVHLMELSPCPLRKVCIMSRSVRFKFFFFVIVAAVVLAGVILAAGNVFRQPRAFPEDRLQSISRGNLALTVVATGSVAPVATVEIKSKASGLIKRIPVEEGAIVQEGDVLIELDRELLQAQLREADANRQAIFARQEEAEAEARTAATLKTKLALDLRNLEENLQFIKRQVVRYETMYAEKLIPRSDWEKTERDMQEASLKAEALRSELLMQDSRIEAARKAVARLKAEVVQSEAALDRVRENLRYATITSPITATVLKRHVEVGDAVSSILQLGSQATLLLTLGDMTEVFVEGRVDESDIGKVFVGQEARVKVDAYRDRVFPGEVTRIAPLGEKIDNVIGFEVRVSITDSDKILRSKMSANAEIIIEEKREILIIPESAIIYDRERKTYTEIYDPATKEMKRRVPIEIGISNGTQTELVSGVKEGDKVLRSTGSGLI